MVEFLLEPKSIAVVGVSVEPQKVGHQVFANLQSFKGKVYPINPKSPKILGHTAYPDLLSIPSHVDLVVIATPAPTVEDIVHQCIDKKVKAVIIIAAGFAETSATGKKLQERIVKKLADNHIALLGPNTLGAANPHAHMNASFAPANIAKGHIGLISQSGAMLTTIFAEFSSRGVGCSFALSLGNSAGIDATQALEYALSDPHTKLIAVYLESLPSLNIMSGKKSFFSLCKEVSKHKPLILLKGGMTSEGQKASLSHTAALATDSTLLREAQHQYGYVMTETIEQFFETTFFLDKILQGQREKVKGKESSDLSIATSKSPSTFTLLPSNLMILTNAGGPGVNSIDVASKEKLPLAEWGRGSIERFAREIPRVKPSNPTDLLGDAGISDIEKALVFANEDRAIESILLIITPQAVTDIPGITKLLIQNASQWHKPLIVALMGGEGQRVYIQKLREASITAVEYANEGVEIFAYTNRARQAQAIDHSLHHTPVPLPSRQSFRLSSNRLQEVYIMLEAYGLILPRCAIVSSVSQLNELDPLDPERVYPLIAKTANLNLKHKAVLGAVIADIENKEDAIEAYQQLKKFGADVLYQEMIEDAIEVIIGCKRDPIYGTFIAVGMGGSLANILADRAYVFLPASSQEIRRAFKRTKLFGELSSEQRSLVISSLESFVDILQDHPEVEELEINPLMVTAHTAYVADVKVTLR